MLNLGNEFRRSSSYFKYQHGSFNSNTDFSVLSNPVDATNVSLQGHHGRDIFPQSLDQYGSGTFNLQLLVLIK